MALLIVKKVTVTGTKNPKCLFEKIPADLFRGFGDCHRNYY